MDTLKELIKIVNRKRLSKIDVFDKTFLSDNNTNLYFKLYEGLESGKITDDASAALYLYGKDDKDAKFRKLKSRFRTKLQKTLLLLDTEDVFINNQSKAYYECLTANQIIEIIIKMTGTTKLVHEIVKENYNKVIQYNFYDIARNYSFYLMSYFAIIGDLKSFDKEKDNYLKFIELAQKEQYAKFIYFKSIVLFENKMPITDALLEEVKQNLAELLSIRLLLQNNIEIDFYYFYLAFEYYQKSNQLNDLIRICNEADTLVASNPKAFTNTRKIISFLYRLSALLSQRKYKEGLAEILEESKFDLPNNYLNWFVLREYEFKLNIQNKNLEGAERTYNEILNNPAYKRQDEKIQEKWKIYHAYFVFMKNFYSNGDFKFNMARFLNDVPVNSKDKSGYNFAIRVIEILFHAAKKDYNLIFSKMDALKIYRTRYLNDITYKRNHLFLSVLIRAEKSGFNSKEMKQANWIELKELRKQNNYIIADWEIIPYEELWDIFVELSKR